MPKYNISGFTYNTPNELSDQELSSLVTRLDNAGVLDPKARQQEFQGREDLKSNPEVLNSYKQYYKRINGEDFKGTPDDLVDSYMEQMRYWNINTASLGALAARLKGNYFSEEEKQGISLMWDAWDRTVPFYQQKEGKWKALGDFAQAAVTDPTNLAGIFSMGGGAVAGAAAREATRGTIKQLIKSYGLQGMKAGTITGAQWSAADSVLQQNVKTDIGLQDEFSYGKLATDAAIGAGAGSLLGGAVGAAQGLNRSRMPKPVATGEQPVTGNPLPGSNVANDIQAGEAFAKAYADPNVVGEEARKQARESFLGSISEEASKFFEGNIGKKVSFEEAKQRSGELLDRIGVKNFDDMEEVATKLVTSFETGNIKAKDLSTLTATTIGVENRLLKLAQEADRNDSELTGALYRQWIKVSGLSSHLSSESARSTAYQANRYRDLFDGVATEAEFFAKAGQIQDPVLARTYLQLVSDKAKEWGKVGVGAINEFWVHNILGALPTITANIAGGTSRLIIDPMKMLGGAVLKGDTKMAKAAASQFAGEVLALKQATHYAWQALKSSSPHLDNRVFNEQVERHNDIVIGNRDYNLNAAVGSGEIWKDTDSVGMNLANMLGNFNRFIGKRLMVSSDELVKQVSFRSSALRIAYLEHLDAGTPDAWKAALADANRAVEDQLKSSAMGVTVENGLAKRALQEARATAFQDDMGSDSIGTLGKGLQSVVNKHPVFTQIVPFVRTPFRIMEYWAAHAPVLQHYTESFKSKINGSPREAAEAEAMVHAGTLFAASAIVAATTLDIEGDGSPNKGEQAVREGRGIKRNTIEVDPKTGASIGINKIDPVARYYTLAAKIKDIYKFGDKDEQGAVLAAMAFAFARNFAEMGSLSGVNQAFQATQSPEAAQKYLGDKVGSAVVPYFRLLADINAEDYKVANDFIEQIYKGLPGVNKNLDLKRDPIFGEKLERPSVALYASPIPKSFRKKDDVDKELIRLGANFNKPDHNIGGVDLRKEKHPNGRTAYDRYQELVGLVEGPDGKSLYEALRDITKDPNYKDELTDPESRVGYTEQGGRLAIFGRVLNGYRRIALNQLGNEMPELGKKLEITKMEHKASKTQTSKNALKEFLAQ